MHEYLILSRGKWDRDKSPDEIQAAIDGFYAWYDQLVEAGRIRPGRRLATQGKVVSKSRVTDGPFTEAKELIGGYWFVVAHSLDAAAELAAENPCLACGLVYEVRPIESRRASAYEEANETPAPDGAAKGADATTLDEPR